MTLITQRSGQYNPVSDPSAVCVKGLSSFAISVSSTQCMSGVFTVVRQKLDLIFHKEL